MSEDIPRTLLSPEAAKILCIVREWATKGRETATPGTELLSDWMNRERSQNSVGAPIIRLAAVPDYLVMAEVVREYGPSFTSTISSDGDWQIQKRDPIGLDFAASIETLVSDGQLVTVPGNLGFECFRLPDGRMVRAFNGKDWIPNPFYFGPPQPGEMAQFPDGYSVWVGNVRILAARPLRPTKAAPLHMPPYTDRFLKLTENTGIDDQAPQGRSTPTKRTRIGKSCDTPAVTNGGDTVMGKRISNESLMAPATLAEDSGVSLGTHPGQCEGGSVEEAVAVSVAFEPEEAEAPKNGTNRKQPPKHAIIAYRLSITSEHTQREIATIMENRLKRPVTQGSVSRWIREVHQYFEAGNVLPDLRSDPAKTFTVDPGMLEMGQRTDPRKARPSDLARTPPDNA